MKTGARRFLRDTAIVLVLLAFLGWLYIFLDRPRDENAAPLVTIDSPFTGAVERGAGGLVLAGHENQRRMAVTPIHLRKNTRYTLTVEATGEPELRLDFWGPNYDSPEQEAWVSEGAKRVQAFMLKSGDAPAQGTFFRVFTEGKEPITIKSLVVKEQRRAPRWLALAILLLAALSGGLYALRYRKIKWVTAAGVGILATTAYFCAPVPQSANSGDNFWYVPTAESLIREGNIELSEYRQSFGEPPTDVRITKVGNRYYNVYPFGTSILSAPLVLIGERLAGNRTEPFRSLFIAAFAAKVLAGLAVSLLYLVLLQLVGRRPVALFLSACFAFCTSHFSLHAGGLWSHNGASLTLCAVLLLLVYGQGRLVPLAAPLLVFGYAIRPEVAISAVVISGYVWWCHRRSFPLFAGLAAIAGLGFVGFCYAVFGTGLPPYYAGSAGGGMTGPHLGEAVAANLFSPNRGLFVFTPIALFSAFGMYLAARRGKPLYISLSLIVFLQWLTVSMSGPWWAGWSYGPRLFALVTPLLIVLLVPVWEHLPNMRPHARFAVLAVFLVAVSWSFLVHLRGATSLSTGLWNARPNIDGHPERVWDWRDWQPLAGLR